MNDPDSNANKTEALFIDLAEKLSTAIFVISYKGSVVYLNSKGKKYLKSKSLKQSKLSYDFSKGTDKRAISELFAINPTEMHFTCEKIYWDLDEAILVILSSKTGFDGDESFTSPKIIDYTYHFSYIYESEVIVSLSKELKSLTGLEEGVLLSELVYPEDLKMLKRKIRNSFKNVGDSVTVIDHRIVSRAAKVYYVRNRIKPEARQDGTTLVIASIALISDLVLETENAKSDKDFYESLLKLSIVGYFKYDLVKEKAVFHRTGAERQGLLKNKQLITRNTIKNYMHHDDWAKMMKETEEFLKIPNNGYSLKFRGLSRVGSYKWYELRLAVTGTDETGNPSLLSGVIMNIDDSHSKLLEAEKYEVLYKTFTSTLGLGFMRLDHEGKIVEWNQALENISGLSASAAIGEYIWDVQSRLFSENTSFVIDPEIYQSDILRMINDPSMKGNSYITKFRTLDGKDKVVRSLEYRASNGKHACLLYLFEDITAKESPESGDGESIELLQEILSFTPNIVYKKNILTGEYIYISPFIEKSLGYKPEDFVRLTESDIYEMIHPHDFVAFHKFHFVPSMRQDFDRTNSSIEYRIKTKSGAYKRIRDTHTYLINKEQNKACLIGLIEDISEEKSKLLELEDILSKYKRILDNQKDLIIVKDFDDVVNYLSPSFCELFGVDELEILGTKYNYKIHADDHRSYKEAIEFLRAPTHNIFNHEHRALTQYGWRWLAWTITSCEQEQGCRELIFVGRDITKQKRIEDALKISEKNYRSIFELAQDAILIFEPKEEIVLDINKKAEEIYGIPREKFIGMSLEALSQDMAFGKSHISKTFKTRFEHKFRSIQKRGDGTTFTVEISAAIIEYDGKSVILSINRPIDERLSD